MTKSKASRRGRPSLGALARTRVSFTLSPDAIEALDELARQKGRNASRAIEDLIFSAGAGTSAALGRLQVSRKKLEGLLIRSGIEQAWLFGSVLRDDFGPESDIDLLVRFKKGACRTYFDFVEVKHELESFFGRPVDLVEDALLDNPIRRREILSHRQEIYAA